MTESIALTTLKLKDVLKLWSNTTRGSKSWWLKIKIHGGACKSFYYRNFQPAVWEVETIVLCEWTDWLGRAENRHAQKLQTVPRAAPRGDSERCRRAAAKCTPGPLRAKKLAAKLPIYRASKVRIRWAQFHRAGKPQLTRTASGKSAKAVTELLLFRVPNLRQAYSSDFDLCPPLPVMFSACEEPRMPLRLLVKLPSMRQKYEVGRLGEA
ncbi:hypothetical protein BOTBODRAFT_621102 [Botryobasidium botryosum FD-172 SS1]|uniref:Uncharacterized protein n=1 Tax=Botryobasidium botryosum (strain FD-172 SS1) TaxID=930990 RepID=A0A067MM43_BOTB1|nr:hypothetical protein BOTBODRAFT_621102 [Botryobasidium botryosum FD-172 SS1]